MNMSRLAIPQFAPHWERAAVKKEEVHSSTRAPGAGPLSILLCQPQLKETGSAPHCRFITASLTSSFLKLKALFFRALPSRFLRLLGAGFRFPLQCLQVLFLGLVSTQTPLKVISLGCENPLLSKSKLATAFSDPRTHISFPCPLYGMWFWGNISS